MGPERPVSLPCDSSETLALMLSRWLLGAEKHDHATARLPTDPRERWAWVDVSRNAAESAGLESVAEAREAVEDESRLL
jgi:hypothetical protein